MSDKIKGVIVDEDYLKELEAIKDSFAYVSTFIKTGSMGMTGLQIHSKEEFSKFIDKKIIKDILNSVNTRNKKKIKEVLHKYSIKI